MPPITLEQALFHRPDREAPRLVARSPGFDDDWLPDAERLVLGFGPRRGGRHCPLAVFAKPISKKHVAVVRVIDENPGFPIGLRFHLLVVERKAYEAWIRDPFLLAHKFEPAWDHPSFPRSGVGTPGSHYLRGGLPEQIRSFPPSGVGTPGSHQGYCRR
jgi:hypothetical protein